LMAVVSYPEMWAQQYEVMNYQRTKSCHKIANANNTNPDPNPNFIP